MEWELTKGEVCGRSARPRLGVEGWARVETPAGWGRGGVMPGSGRGCSETGWSRVGSWPLEREIPSVLVSWRRNF